MPNLHGFTRQGAAVHRRTVDHHRDDTAYQRLNKRVALWLVKNVGTMTCYWLFTLISLVSLPAVLVVLVAGFAGVFPHALIAAGLIVLVQWVSGNYIQLTLLPAIMVGQNLQSAASDTRAAKTFEDTELIVDRLDTSTEGGLQEVLAEIADVKSMLGKKKK